jgi:hypothetical protein
MSILVPLLSSETLEAEAETKRVVLRRRLMLAAVTVVFIGGLAAVPIPTRHAFEKLLVEIAALEDSVLAHRADQRELDEWHARLGSEPLDLAARAARWLGNVDPIVLRNHLIVVAGPCGLSLRGLAVEEGVKPLAGEEVMASLRMVLGKVEEADPFGDPDGRPAETEEQDANIPMLTATRYTISGDGPVSGVILFAGLLRQLPEPLRLLSIDMSISDGGARFTLIADRLSCPLNAEILEGAS